MCRLRNLLIVVALGFALVSLTLVLSIPTALNDSKDTQEDEKEVDAPIPLNHANDRALEREREAEEEVQEQTQRQTQKKEKKKAVHVVPKDPSPRAAQDEELRKRWERHQLTPEEQKLKDLGQYWHVALSGGRTRDGSTMVESVWCDPEWDQRRMTRHMEGSGIQSTAQHDT